MSTVTPTPAMPPAASDLRGNHCAAGSRVVHRAANEAVTEAVPSGSTRVTLGTTASAVYTDRIGGRPRVSVEAMLAGHAVRASGLAAVANAGGARQLTYSFSPQVGSATPLNADGGAASNEQQQAAIRAVAYLSSMMNVRFVEVALGGQINFGGSVPSPTGDSSGDDAVTSVVAAAAPAGSAAEPSGDWAPTSAGSPPVVESAKAHPVAPPPIQPPTGVG